MTLPVFLAAIVVWAVFRHQSRRHRLELKAESARRGLEWTEANPKVPFLESMLTALVGLVTAAGSSVLLLVIFSEGSPQMWGLVGEFAMGGLALGAALMILGIRALGRYRR